MYAKTIAICNQKGGVGKTTTTINMGAGLAKEGKKVLAVDFDPQGNLSMSLDGIDPENLEHTISDYFNQIIQDQEQTPMQDAIISVEDEGIDVIPSNLQLSGVETMLSNTVSREYILKELLEPLRPLYDYILIDCAPSLGILTINALTAADSVLIPTQAEYLSVKGTEMVLQRTIQMVKRRLNKALEVEGILITMIDERTILEREMRSNISEAYGEHIRIFGSVIPRSIKVKEASAAGRSIFNHQPEGKAAAAYAAITSELLAG